VAGTVSVARYVCGAPGVARGVPCTGRCGDNKMPRRMSGECREVPGSGPVTGVGWCAAVIEGILGRQPDILLSGECREVPGSGPVTGVGWYAAVTEGIRGRQPDILVSP